MPTKEEILKKKKYDYVMESISNGFKDQKLSTPILSSMEEYAKQEAIGFHEFLCQIDYSIWNRKFHSLGRLPNSEDAWQAYQLHKATEQQKIADAMQTHDELIKAKNAAK